MHKLLFTLAIGFLASAPCFAQSPATWRGLEFGQTTPEDAVRILRTAKKDQPNQKLEIASKRGAEWLNFTGKDKIFRRMVFEKPEGFRSAALYFKDGKLAAIELEPKYTFEEGWLDPDDLDTTFASDFKPHNAVFGGKPLGTPAEFAASGDVTTKDELRAFYEMIAVSEKHLIFASVDNRQPVNASILGGSSGRQASKEKDKRDADGSFPGHVTSIQIFGRTLIR